MISTLGTNCKHKHIIQCLDVLRGLEQALDHYGQTAPASRAAAESEAAGGGGDEAGKEARRTFMREKRKHAWKQLTVPERDVLTVLAAVCKVSHTLPG